jgi:raffinose/stachyose/melibiose transport system substrate-binding protein
MSRARTQIGRPRDTLRLTVNGGRLPLGALLAVVVALAVGASQARPAGSDSITITMLSFTTNQPAFQVLIPNFERVYPNITVNPTYISSSLANQLEPTEFAVGNAPDLMTDFPGSEAPDSVCRLQAFGWLAPLVKVPWTKRMPPAMTSLSKCGEGLYVFEPQIALYGIFTNNALFAKLGLKVPQTFAQLIDVCKKAKAAGTTAMILDGAGTDSAMFIRALAIPLVYGQDKHWTAQRKAGAVTFDGTPGWQQALQEFVEMNSVGCFQPGASATSLSDAEADFAEGQGLMYANHSGQKGILDALQPQFAYSFAPFPAASTPGQTATYVHISSGLSINAHSSPEAQAAALAFINFIARPKQNALYAQETGGMTSYQFLKGQLPSFMSGFAPVLAHDLYIVDPAAPWTGGVGGAFGQGGQGLLTGQSTVDGVLNAMDAAWAAATSPAGP